ncbi:MAG: hypothetical protein DCC73_04215 [Proteobacteria bacterium]|jgi:uncharacterized protein YdcH (DUF465 family)|nr:MAG: hypothetical protein DCC73_04215 [Pseudomonadota bacterium]
MTPPQEALDNAKNPVLTLISLTRRLGEVVRQENTLLNQRRPSEATTLIEEKGRLAAAYGREMDILRKNGGARAFGSADQLRELKRETSAFRKLLDEHRRILERVRTVSEGMLKAVGEEVARRSRPPQGYGKNAAPATPRQTPPATLTLNQVI